MKFIKLILTVAASAMLLTSCSILSGVAGNSTAAAEATSTSAGSAIGTALGSIFGQYEKDSKIDLGNLGTLINIATIANNLGLFKTSLTDSQATAAFTQGLISGSNNLVNAANSAAVISSLKTLANTNLKQFTSDTKSVDENSAQSIAAVNALTSIFSQFK
ncbi:MAG: hypothetical protein Q4G10_06335 [Bacteroidia bacterium]|nr:hypothetical protein [Bacteroidia bacterium]